MTSLAAGAAVPVLAASGACAAGAERKDIRPTRFKPIDIPGLAPRPDFWKVRPQEIMKLCEGANVSRCAA